MDPTILVVADLRAVLALAGATLLFVGAFLPIVSVPFLGTLNYFANGTGDGVLIIAAALAATVLAVRRQYAWLLLPGTAAALLLVMTGLRLTMALSAFRDDGAASHSELLAELGRAMERAVQVQWGWAVMSVGAALVVAAGVMGWRRIPRTDVQRGRTLIGTAVAGVLVVLTWLVGGGQSASALGGSTASGTVSDDDRQPGRGWAVERSSWGSVMGGGETVRLMLEADRQLEGIYGPDPTALLIRCEDNETVAYVVAGALLPRTPGTYRKIRVQYRIDDEEPVTELWHESESSTSAFSPSPVALAKRLAAAERLPVDLATVSHGQQRLTFPLRGLNQHIGELAWACGWAYP